MKKRVSFSTRLLSIMLALMLIIGTASIGVTTVSARDYKSGEVANLLKIEKGVFFEKGAILSPTVEYYYSSRVTRKKIRVFIDDELYAEGNEDVTFDRSVVLTNTDYELESYTNILEFTSVGDKDFEVTTEDELRAALKGGGAVKLNNDITINDSLVFDDGKAHTLNANGYSLRINRAELAIIKVRDGSTLTLIGTGADSSSMLTGESNDLEYSRGIVVEKNSKLIMKDMKICENRAQEMSGFGGAVDYSGGGVFVKDSTVELTNCTFEKNAAVEGSGGGLSLYGNSTATVWNCTFLNNAADKNGGGLYVDTDSTATLTDCTFESNSANDGGGIANLGKLTLNNCKVSVNTVKGGGAGIWSKGTASISDTSITQNSNAVNGGGVTNHGVMTLTNCTVSGNQVSNNGGGVYIDTSGKTELNNCTVGSNAAKDGAGIFMSKGTLGVTNSVIEKNLAKGAGGGMWANSGTTATFSGSKITENTCETNGGGLNSHGTVSLSKCTVSSCTAKSSGGGIYMDTNSTLTVGASEITYCTSASGGGGINFYAGSLILTGEKTRITNSTSGGRCSNVYFRVLNPIQVTGSFPSGSVVGITPPDGCNNKNATTGYGQFNSANPADIFQIDSNEYKINRDYTSEANLIATMRAADHTSYSIKITIDVVDDADYWDYAYFYVYGKSGRGIGSEEQIKSTGDFRESIDHNGGSYTFEHDCGSDYFPTAVKFVTKFGLTTVGWREFKGNIKIWINGVNVCSTTAFHEAYGVQEKSTLINIGGDKYPYPEDFEVDAPPVIDTSGVVTISAVDQYGLRWKLSDNNVSMENISFPEQDTFEQADNTGLKWRLSSDHISNHHSVYEVTFRSGSNVYPTITKSISVKFKVPLRLKVIVDGKVAFEAKGQSGDKIHFDVPQAPAGYYIKEFSEEGVGLREEVKDKKVVVGYDFTFINDPVTLTAVLKPNNYIISLKKNNVKGQKVKGNVSNYTVYYDTPWELKTGITSTGYTLAGWNTQADGMGKMYHDGESLLNLTTKKGDKVTLYAIWKSETASTTASIFSEGTTLIYVGCAIFLIAVAAGIIYSIVKKKKTQGKE